MIRLFRIGKISFFATVWTSLPINGDRIYNGAMDNAAAVACLRSERYRLALERIDNSSFVRTAPSPASKSVTPKQTLRRRM
jgi:hypothetical protein